MYLQSIELEKNMKIKDLNFEGEESQKPIIHVFWKAIVFQKSRIS